MHGYEIHEPWVFLIEGGLTRKQAIDIGLVSQGIVQVLSGLKVGDMVLPNQYTHLGDRSRVRVIR